MNKHGSMNSLRGPSYIQTAAAVSERFRLLLPTLVDFSNFAVNSVFPVYASHHQLMYRHRLEIKYGLQHSTAVFSVQYGGGRRWYEEPKVVGKDVLLAKHFEPRGAKSPLGKIDVNWQTDLVAAATNYSRHRWPAEWFPQLFLSDLANPDLPFEEKVKTMPIDTANLQSFARLGRSTGKSIPLHQTPLMPLLEFFHWLDNAEVVRRSHRDNSWQPKEYQLAVVRKLERQMKLGSPVFWTHA